MNKDLLAATSVFAEMVNKNIDYRDIICEFILSVYRIEKKHSLDSQAILIALESHYNFNIPEAIIVTNLQRLSNDGKLDYVSGSYIISPELLSQQAELKIKFEAKELTHSNILKKLFKYIEFNSGKLTKANELMIEAQFSKYLFDDEFNGQYSEKISNFILKNSEDERFKIELNLIREGITILRGIQYSANEVDSKVWSKEITIYLDTEHLFSFCGLNGDIYKKLLLDFYTLVKEINTSLGRKIIFLKYFKEAEEEVNYFFDTAQKIIEGKRNKNISKVAMEEILNGIVDKAGVIRKQVNFFNKLKSAGITSMEIVEIPPDKLVFYNVNDPIFFEKYDKKEGDKEKIYSVLDSFTKVNYLRNGLNNKRLEEIRHLILSGDYLTKVLSKDVETKVEETDFSYATDIYYITQRLWFRLHKGLGFKGALPTTLDVVAKAQVIISTKLNTEVGKRYEALKNSVISGERDEEGVKDFYLKLRSNIVKPEEINSENIDEKILFLYEEEDMDNFLRKQSRLKSEISKLKKFKEERINQDKELKEKLGLEQLNKDKYSLLVYRNKLKKLKYVFLCIFYLIPILLIILIFLNYINSGKENFFSTLNTIFSFITFLYFLGFKKLKTFLKNYLYNKESEFIKTLNPVSIKKLGITQLKNQW